MFSQETQGCVIKQHTQQNHLQSVQRVAGTNKHNKKETTRTQSVPSTHHSAQTCSKH